MRESDRFDISSAGLHILAMAIMLCDHLGMVLFPQAAWMRSVSDFRFFACGRILPHKGLHKICRTDVCLCIDSGGTV